MATNHMAQRSMCRAFSNDLGRIADDPARSAIFAWVLATRLSDLGTTDATVTPARLLSALETAIAHAEQQTELVGQLRRAQAETLAYVNSRESED